MKQRCFSLLLVYSFWSCDGTPLNDQIPTLLELSLVDSVEIKESHGFLSRPSNSVLINDSLLGIESFSNKAIWIIDTKTGKEVSSILSGEEKGINFRPTKVIWNDFPIVYLLDGTTQKIHIFNLSKSAVKGDKHIKTISLETPNNLRIKPMLLGLFSKYQDKFYIEHSTNEVPFSSNKFYTLTDKLIGIYDENGKFLENIYDFPYQLKNLQKFIAPGKIFNSGISKAGELLISFSFTKMITKTRLSSSQKIIDSIPLPISKYFLYDIPYLEQEIDNTPGTPKNYPTPNYFGDIFVDSENIIYQTFIKDQTQPEIKKIYSNVMKYDFNKSQWYETNLLYDFIDLGFLAGASADTLYFVEASTIRKDQKHIKRAILINHNR